MGKRNRSIQKIEDKKKRLVCFSKRRKGLFKKAQELSSLTGAQTAILLFSETGRPYIQPSPSSSSSSSFQSLLRRFLTTSSTPAEAEESSNVDSLTALLNFEVEDCDDVEELLELKEKLEEMRERAAMALDWRFAGSLLSEFDNSILHC